MSTAAKWCFKSEHWLGVKPGQWSAFKKQNKALLLMNHLRNNPSFFWLIATGTSKHNGILKFAQFFFPILKCHFSLQPLFYMMPDVLTSSGILGPILRFHFSLDYYEISIRIPNPSGILNFLCLFLYSEKTKYPCIDFFIIFFYHLFSSLKNLFLYISV